jgi:short subunit dehydrogenase-like uncharacterized protein
MPESNRPVHDLIIFGATSFVGQLTAHYLAGHVQAQGVKLNWALAGRSQAKLEQVRRSLGAGWEQLPLVLADAADAAQLHAMCAQTRLVVSTVGPYALYGEPLVRACAESGTDYCDLTGETQWIKRMIDHYEAMAKQSGARIVHCCGFDSIPSDLGVRFLQRQALERWGEPAVQVKMRVRTLKGGASGGTVASIVNVVREASTDAEARRVLLNPFSLCPPGHGFTARQTRVSGAGHDADFGAWMAPFIMGSINEAVVRRSNALMPESHTPGFSYHEAMLTGSGAKGWATACSISAATAAFMAGVALPPTRYLLERFALPKPGEGPSEAQRQAGHYDLRFLGVSASGKRLRTCVTGEGDPGYASTSRLLGQSALCLALDDAVVKQGGFWTPASLLGDALQARLTRHDVLRFEVLE